MLVYGVVLFLVLSVGFSLIFSSVVIGIVVSLLVICFGLFLDRKATNSKRAIKKKGVNMRKTLTIVLGFMLAGAIGYTTAYATSMF